jgi:hypothetical protein
MGDEPVNRRGKGPIHPRVERRRTLAASLYIPTELSETFGKFTDSQLAVLKIVSGEVVRHGACTLTQNAIGALSAAGHTVVKVALRTAKAEGLIKIELGQRHNTITIISPTWNAWLDRYGDAPTTG